MEPNDKKELLMVLIKKLLAKRKLRIFPFERKSVYSLLRDISMDQHLYLNRLSIITAYTSIVVWKNHNPFIEYPMKFLEVAHKILLKQETIENGLLLAQQGWIWLEEIGAKRPKENDSGSFFAASAAWEALMEVTGKDPFFEVEITKKTRDDDLDFWSSDTTKWASYAYNHKIGADRTYSEKYSNFYLWWLNIAIPKALDLSKRDLLT